MAAAQLPAKTGARLNGVPPRPQKPEEPTLNVGVEGVEAGPQGKSHGRPKKPVEPTLTASELMAGKDTYKKPHVQRGQKQVGPLGNADFYHSVEEAHTFAQKHNHVNTTMNHGSHVWGTLSNGVNRGLDQREMNRQSRQAWEKEQAAERSAAAALKREEARDAMTKEHIKQMAAFMTSVGQGGVTPNAGVGARSAGIR